MLTAASDINVKSLSIRKRLQRVGLTCKPVKERGIFKGMEILDGAGNRIHETPYCNASKALLIAEERERMSGCD